VEGVLIALYYIEHFRGASQVPMCLSLVYVRPTSYDASLGEETAKMESQFDNEET